MATSAQPHLANGKPQFIDIGINLADPIFRGIYHGQQRHNDDLPAVVQRAIDTGCQKMIITGSDFASIRDATVISKQYYLAKEEATEAVPDQERTAVAIAQLKELIDESSSSKSLVALGEFGLDYDRLHYCNKAIQIHSFDEQLRLAASMQQQLPLFLHSRAAHRDFVDLLKKHYGPRLEKLEKGGVVHSFTGTIEEMTELMDLGLYIGVNGCSLKTAENCEAVKAISLNRIMLETDGPWCEVRPSHEGWKYLLPNEGHTQADIASTIIDSKVPAKKKNQPKKPEPKITEVTDIYKVVKKEKWVEGCMVKGRNEPCMIGRVATIVAGIKGITVEELCKHAWENTTKVFRVVDDCK
ncbi:TatD family hydrolase [Ceratocystis lukuohia]|uniref:TatD family hydrolase n=1 Tax=Ceratocystis lukuohia TaxID=2019550 RepID=A0ABR4MLA5_9PEZI